MANDRVQAKIDLIKGKDETGEVKSSLNSFSSSLSRVGEIAAGIGLARVAEEIVEVGKASATFAFDSAKNMEQWKIAFDTMLQSPQKASKLLSDITDFAKQTPFELEQLIDGSKRLLAYNFSAEQVIPTMRMLGNIAAGVGTEKLPQLILAFGQVNAATKLTGAELRQFTEAGVPLLEALVKKANQAGGVLTKVGGASEATTKKAASLSAKLVDMQFNMDLLTKYGKNNGMQWEKLQHNYEKTKNELASFGSTGQAVYKRVKVNAEQMIEKISGGGVKFKDVNEALMAMTQEGGKFANLMGNQMDTVGTKLSNLKDNMFKLSLMIMGFDMKQGSETFGEVKEGSIFDRISNGLTQVVAQIDANEGKITGFFEALVRSGEAFWGVLAKLGEHIKIAFTPVMHHLAEIYDRHRERIDKIAHVLGMVLYAAITAFIYAASMAIDVIAAWVDLTLNAWGPAIDYVHAAVTNLGQQWNAIMTTMRSTFESVVNFVIDGVNKIIDAWNKLPITDVGKMGKIGISASNIAPQMSIPASFAPAVNYTPMSGGNYSRNVSIVNNNNFSTNYDPKAFASYQAWQINGR